MNMQVRISQKHTLPLLLMLAGVLLLVACGGYALPGISSAPTATPVDVGSVTVSILNPGLTNVVISVLGQPWVDNLADDGRLLLPACNDGQVVTAWSPGYYIASQLCKTGQTNYEFTLQAYGLNDNTSFSWVTAHNSGLPRNCELCHSGANGLEYIEWQVDGHARVFKNQYFGTTYLGSDVSRNRSPDTLWILGPDNLYHRQMPDRSKPYFGPGFKIDFPAENGNCAYCHAPASVSSAQTPVDLTSVIFAALNGQVSSATEGITCDVCHKVLNVHLAQDNKPFPDKPGILSYEFVREQPNTTRLYVGPLPGAVTDAGSSIGVTCAPVYSQSQFCAPCHYAKFWDTQIYNSYGEWLASPYSNPENKADYKTCQACHMQVNGLKEGDPAVLTPAREACSQSNVAYHDFNHNMMQRGADNVPALIKDAAVLKVDTLKADGKVQVRVRVTNQRAGHKFPTDSPLRHLILVVDVTDKNGTVMTQVGGTTIPLWGGMGNNPATDFAGRPGVIFANLLMDKDTNISPTFSYWNPTQPAWATSDTRLLPLQPVDSEYAFAAPANGAAVVYVRLIYRNVFIEIARQKGWSVMDMVVTDVKVDVP